MAEDEEVGTVIQTLSGDPRPNGCKKLSGVVTNMFHPERGWNERRDNY